MCIKNLKILKNGLWKIIKPVKKDKSEPTTDTIDKNQELSLLENINQFSKIKNLKNFFLSDSKPVIRPIIIRKLIF